MARDRCRCAVVALCVAASVVLVTAVSVEAQDSAAPPGVTPRWLPCERWVMLHWVPYDEQQLFRMLGMSSAQARAWMRDVSITTSLRCYAGVA
jgi:hypothetical protein